MKIDNFFDNNIDLDKTLQHRRIAIGRAIQQANKILATEKAKPEANTFKIQQIEQRIAEFEDLLNKANSDSSESSNSNDNDGQAKNPQDGESNSSKTSQTKPKINPFKLTAGKNTSGNGPNTLNRADILQGIIDALNTEVSQDGQVGVKRALEDLINNNIDYLKESLRPLPDKNFKDWSAEEFTNTLNNFLDELDSVSHIEFDDPTIKQNKIKKIKQDARNIEKNNELAQEDQEILDSDPVIVQARQRELDKYNKLRSFQDFKISFWNAIKDQVKAVKKREEDSLKINAKYEGENVIVPGYSDSYRKNRNEIPSVAIYLDRSGSWGSTKDIEISNQILSTVKNFKDKGEIILDVYYFSDILATSANDPALGKGTDAWKHIIGNILDHNYKNIVLVTDTDMNWQAGGSSLVKVPGIVWFIWKNGYVADNLPKKLQGKIATLQFEC